MESAISVTGHGLLLASVGALYVAWRHPILDYHKDIHVNVPVVGQQAADLHGSRSLFVSSDGIEAVVPQLWEEGSYPSALAVIAFGAVIPICKVLLTLRSDALCSKWARFLARWTLVDALAEALVVALLLSGHVQANLREGFFAFFVYVACSHAALALLRAHPVEESSAVGAINPIVPVGVFAMVFVVAFHVGCQRAAVQLWLSDSVILQTLHTAIAANPMSNMLPMIGQTIESLAISLKPQIEPIHGSVSLISASAWLLAAHGPISQFAGFVLLVLVVLLPVFDVILSVYVCTRFVGQSPWAETVRKHVHDLASLDVLVVGTFICCIVTKNVQQLSAAPERGLASLACAALCQNLAHRFAAPRATKAPQDMV